MTETRRDMSCFQKVYFELSFPALMERVRLLMPRITVLTLIEEIEVNAWGWDHLGEMRKQYSDINFDFAHDGMKNQT